MTNDDLLFGYRLQLLALAAEIGVRPACRQMGVHHSTYYRWKRRAERHGLEVLRPRERRAPRMPNRIPAMVEERIVAFSLGHAGLGPRRIAAQLRRPEWGALRVSPNGVWKVLCRHGLNTRARRLALVAGYRAPREPPREPAPEHFAHELLAPVEAVLNTRVARGADARRALADAAAARAGDVDADCRADAMRQNTLEFSLADALSEKRVIALGWLLANGSTHEMQAALCAPRHTQAVTDVQQALGVEAADLCSAEAAGRDSGMRPVRR
jgi:transposase